MGQYYALWVRRPNDAAPFFAAWVYMDNTQYQQMHRWVNHQMYPCLWDDRGTGAIEITLMDLHGNKAYSVPSCPPGMVA